MELSPACPRRTWSACSLALALAALAGCQADDNTTGVRLAIHYDSAPSRLRVLGRSDDGMRYGPELLPDPLPLLRRPCCAY